MSFSLSDDFIDDVLASTVPSFQLTSPETRNLGFGNLYYAMVRAMRPRTVVVIGSKAGFAPIMFARALKDNEGHGIVKVDCEQTTMAVEGHGHTKLHFIDPSFSLHRGDTNHWYGLGNWDDSKAVEAKWAHFGLQDIIQHHKMTSQDYVTSLTPIDSIDILYIDGDHSYEGVKHDFEAFLPFLSDEAVVMAHDVDPRLDEGGGFRAFSDLPDTMYEKVRLPAFPGLAICRKKRGAER